MMQQWGGGYRLASSWSTVLNTPPGPCHCSSAPPIRSTIISAQKEELNMSEKYSFLVVKYPKAER